MDPLDCRATVPVAVAASYGLAGSLPLLATGTVALQFACWLLDVFENGCTVACVDGTECEISDDRRRLDVDLIHRYLSEESYWARGIPRAVVERSLAGSVCFGAYRKDADAAGSERTAPLEETPQVGFARVVTDRATFAYLADVFVLPEHRGRGLSKRLMEAVSAHADRQGLRRWMLATRDAHSLYAQYGFKPLAAPARMMERHFPAIYQCGEQ